MGSDLRLDDGRLSWVDLHAVIFAAPPNSAVFHAFEQGWDTTAYLVAIMADGIHDLIWQKTKDGQKNRKRPKRIQRPKRGDGDGTASTGLGRVSVMTVEEFELKRAERQARWVERKQRERQQVREAKAG